MAKKPVTKKPTATKAGELAEPKNTGSESIDAKGDQASKKEAAPKAASKTSNEVGSTEKPASGGMAGKLSIGVGLLLCGVAAGALLGPRFSPQYFGANSSETEARLVQYQAATDDRIAALESKELPNYSADIDAASAALSSQFETQVQDLKTQIAATDGSDIEARLAEVETAIAGLRAAFDSMADDLNAANATGTNAQIDTTLAEIASLQSQIQELSAMNGALSQKIDEIDISATKSVEEAAQKSAEVQEAAAATTQAAERDRLIGNLDAALQRGETLSSYLAALGTLGIDVPQALANAEAGVARLSDLQESFSPAAHAALRADAANASDESGVRGQLQSFFQSQISVRSLDAKDGDGTDAILSRMEQALELGDVQTVIDESATLSDPAQEAMADWLNQATTRLNAFRALSELKQGS
ncbi:MAG: hypothetical protein AAF429_00980 [Pseudomonadota bacterium]